MNEEWGLVDVVEVNVAFETCVWTTVALQSHIKRERAKPLVKKAEMINDLAGAQKWNTTKESQKLV